MCLSMPYTLGISHENLRIKVFSKDSSRCIWLSEVSLQILMSPVREANHPSYCPRPFQCLRPIIPQSLYSSACGISHPKPQEPGFHPLRSRQPRPGPLPLAAAGPQPHQHSPWGAQPGLGGPPGAWQPGERGSSSLGVTCRMGEQQPECGGMRDWSVLTGL